MFVLLQILMLWQLGDGSFFFVVKACSFSYSSEHTRGAIVVAGFYLSNCSC